MMFCHSLQCFLQIAFINTFKTFQHERLIKMMHLSQFKCIEISLNRSQRNGARNLPLFRDDMFSVADVSANNTDRSTL
ncbi:hypothetical protein D3C80_2086910 [compost metagenome]